MYPQPSQGGQWNPNPPTPSTGAQQQQGQQQWAPSPGSQQSPQAHQPQPNGQYGRPQAQMPPMSQAHQGPPPNMGTLQPQHPDQYRSLPPPPMYSHSPYHAQPQMAYPPHQPAPRQRTAIACRYCRRRKIRCSGFDQSEDGRCSNCQRFSQECVFTPVNQQTQAFVPAHAVLGRQGGQMPTQFFGAFGQPIAPPFYPPQGYGPPNGHYQQPAPYPPHMQQPGQPGQHPLPGPIPGQQPSPTDSAQQPGVPPPQPGQHAPLPPQMGQQSPGQHPPQLAGQKRANEEPHTPTTGPPNPALAAQAAQAQQRSASASSSASLPHPNHQAPHTSPKSQPPQHAQTAVQDGSAESKGENGGMANTHDRGAVQNGYPALKSETNVPPPMASHEATNGESHVSHAHASPARTDKVELKAK